MSSSTSRELCAVADYYCRSKHTLADGAPRSQERRHERSEAAPSPFLRFSGAPEIRLPNPPPALSPVPYPTLFHSPPPAAQPLNVDSISALLFHSLALSAWKKSSSSSAWSALRVNPSSGNRHPTEAHLVFPHPQERRRLAVVAHYAPREHLLEVRAAPPAGVLPAPASAVVALSSVLWRESFKYGERALRYCHHDLGHAVAAVAVAAAALGWDARLLDGLSDEDLGRLVGRDRGCPPPPAEGGKPEMRFIRGKAPWVERQHPGCAVLLFPAGSEPRVDYGRMSEALKGFDGLEWAGQASELSKQHVVWDLIYRTAHRVARRRHGGGREEPFVTVPWQRSPSYLSSEVGRQEEPITVQEVARRRRSAPALDRAHVMARETFYQMLLRCLPSGDERRQGPQGALPFRVLPWDAQVHAALFVHRVAGLPQGLYFLVRNGAHLAALRRAMSPEFEWVPPEGCPEALPLYRLIKGDYQQVAMQVSCFQESTANGCFSLGMIARFERVLRDIGEWMYPRLFWETGVLGQVLYLEAHAVGISARGIGCYFDDAIHEVLGFKDLEFQSLYHFTVGAPLPDERMTLPAYPGPGNDV